MYLLDWTVFIVSKITYFYLDGDHLEMTDYFFANQIVPFLLDDEIFDEEPITEPSKTVPTTVATTTVTSNVLTNQPFTTTRRTRNTVYNHNRSRCITRRCRIMEERFAKRQRQAVRNDRP